MEDPFTARRLNSKNETKYRVYQRNTIPLTSRPDEYQSLLESMLDTADGQAYEDLIMYKQYCTITILSKKRPLTYDEFKLQQGINNKLTIFKHSIANGTIVVIYIRPLGKDNDNKAKNEYNKGVSDVFNSLASLQNSYKYRIFIDKLKNMQKYSKIKHQVYTYGSITLMTQYMFSISRISEEHLFDNVSIPTMHYSDPLCFFIPFIDFSKDTGLYIKFDNGNEQHRHLLNNPITMQNDNNNGEKSDTESDDDEDIENSDTNNH